MKPYLGSPKRDIPSVLLGFWFVPFDAHVHIEQSDDRPILLISIDLIVDRPFMQLGDFFMDIIGRLVDRAILKRPLGSID